MVHTSAYSRQHFCRRTNSPRTSMKIQSTNIVVVITVLLTVIVIASLSSSSLVGVTALPRPFGITTCTTKTTTATSHGTNRTNKISRGGGGSGNKKSSSSSSSSSDNSSSGRKRGKVLKERFDKYDLLRAYREIQTEYREKAFGGDYDEARDAGAETGEEGEDNSRDEEENNVQQRWKVLTTINPNESSYSNKKRKKKKKYTDATIDKDDEMITVSMLEHPSDPLCPYVKMTAILPISVKKCWDFLSLDKWDKTMPTMDPFYDKLDIYGEYNINDTNEIENENENKRKQKLKRKQNHDNSNSNNIIRMILARKRTKRILTFGKREFVFVSVMDKPLEDGTWVSGTVSVEINEGDDDDDVDVDDSNNNSTEKGLLLPSLHRNKSYTRAFQDSIAFYKPIPGKTTTQMTTTTTTNDSNNSDVSSSPSPLLLSRTKLTIICRIDLNDSSEEQGTGGCIPMWLYVKTIGITGARSVLNMRKALLKEEEKEDATI
eukprot:CAMPEP_0170802354 /NCGR_PEP_ID=MMETSP0733-20121128/29214_1 /TAXON_ID=186038 /ORGANISM="Fragilariopsis kerguelensis, Strain L26-C5" /LENGTH=489 /DNA_ID=CAMNT_0011155507 /DNA_START=239 /DNA_END=1708 /DNA_ORIENTATION=+